MAGTEQSPAADSGAAAAPSAEATRVLQLEDTATDAELVRRHLLEANSNLLFRTVADQRAFREALVDFAPHIVLSDFSLPGFDGLSALAIAREIAPAKPFIFVSGTIGEERAIEAMKHGATDYVLKDNLRRLVPAIENALRQAQVATAKEIAEEMLRRSESRLKDIIDTSRDWIWECDSSGRFTFSSPSVADLLGYTHHQMMGRAAVDYVDAADRLQLQATFAEPLSEESLEKPVTLRWRHKNGSVRWLERRMVALRDREGALRGVRGMDRDVTHRVAQDFRIRRLNRALRFLSGASSAGVRIRNRDQLVREACRLAVSAGGYERATFYLLPSDFANSRPFVCSYRHASGGEDATWSVGDTLPSGVSLVTQAIATAQPVIVDDFSTDTHVGLIANDPHGKRSGSRIALPMLADRKVMGVMELDASEPSVFGEAELALLKQVAGNITFSLQYLRSKQSAEYLESFDSLTGLANRMRYLRRLESALEAATRDARKVGIAVVDVTDVGMINDNLGHHAADLVLQQVAERLRGVFQDSSALCRLSGDRFAAMCPDGEGDALETLKSRIGGVFATPFSVQGHDIHVAMRAGLVLSPDDGTHAETLLQAAQIALQHCAHTGAATARYQPQMNETTSQRFNLTKDLRHAVAERQFALHYQPKLDVESWAVKGAEALIRWPGANQSVPPNVFVPMLESLGLIDEVGEWVIVQAMKETARWTTAHGFRVAVNVSPLQLNREDFAERVLAAIAAVGADATRLELEVTESSLMADPQRASASLCLLREAGASVAIDDFGTGHSSLRMLAGLPIDVLKIDRSFVCDLASNRSHRLIVQTTIGLAKSLGLKTVAEGVETVEQLRMLRDLGCDSMQGYLISRPATAGAVQEWLASEPLMTLHEAILAEAEQDNGGSRPTRNPRRPE